MSFPGDYDKSWWLQRAVIAESGCWEWQGATKGNGYGNIRVGAKNYPAHRLAMMQIAKSKLDGLDVCHQCDNRSCVNPDHLFIGSRKVNMQDAVNKGRQASGFDLPGTRLSDSDRKEIVSRAKGRELYREIASDYGVCPQLIGKVARENGITRR